MSENTQHYASLILKFVRGTISVSEQDELNTWINASPINRAIFENLDTAEKIMDELQTHGEVSKIAQRARERLGKLFIH